MKIILIVLAGVCVMGLLIAMFEEIKRDLKTNKNRRNKNGK